MKPILSLTLLGLLAFPASAATVTFGTAPNQFTMDFVDVDNPGNADDIEGLGYGGVSYAYSIGTHEVSTDMVTKANTAGGLGLTPDSRGVNKPATGLSWNEAARFVNWLNTSSGFQAAYDFTTGGSNDNITLWPSGVAWQLGGENLFRHKDAHYFLPSEDEWYKAAYYDGTTNTYFDFATGSNTAPTAVASGTTAGTAVYDLTGLGGGPADIMNAGGLSPYGTMAQGGNVHEWVESGFTAPNDSAAEDRADRGGAWFHSSSDLRSSTRIGIIPTFTDNGTGGFRVAAVPEPSVSVLVLTGAIGLIIRRKRWEAFLT